MALPGTACQFKMPAFNHIGPPRVIDVVFLATRQPHQESIVKFVQI